MDKFFLGLIGGFVGAKALTPAQAEYIEQYVTREGGAVTDAGFIGGWGPELQDINYGDKVYVDPTAAGGTAYPAGTRRYPCADLAEARTVAAAQGLSKYHLIGLNTLDADMTGVTFEADINQFALGSAGGSLDLNGLSVDGCLFINVTVTGTPHAATVDSIFQIGGAHYCDTNEIQGIFINCLFAAGTHFMGDNSYLIDCSSAPTAVLSIDDNTLIAENFKGNVQIVSAIAGSVIRFNGEGVLTVAASCTGGDLYTTGNIVVNGAGGGITISDLTNYYILNTLATRLSAARAGYLDEIDEIHDKAIFKLSPVASAMIEEVQLTAVAGDKALGSIVVNTIPTGAVVTFAQAIFSCRVIENTNANANKLNGAQYIQINKGGGAWVNAIGFVDDALGIAGNTREGGVVVYGTINLSGTVTGNDTYNLQWDEAVADAGNLQFNDCQVMLYIEYSI